MKVWRGIRKDECRKMSAQKEEEQAGGTLLRIRRGAGTPGQGHHKRLRKSNAGPVGKEAKGFLISQKEEKLEHFP